MPAVIDTTHDPQKRCWVTSAHAPHTDFPIQNLPWGVFRRKGSSEQPRVGVAIGDQIVDLTACLNAGLCDGPAAQAAATCDAPMLNGLMVLGHPAWLALRQAVSTLLWADSPVADRAAELAPKILVSQADAELLLPAHIGDYTDFYASVFHATNVGSMFRPDNPLLPNYKYVPIGYHGRASSVVVSGTSVHRPQGQTRPPDAAVPRFGPAQQLDYEAELGLFVGPGNALGAPIGIDAADEHLFGVCLMNDWSARDIQSWEYQPLGPFLSKSFATSIGSWVVSMDALAPFRRPPFERPAGDPEPLPYLDSPDNRAHGGIDLTLEVWLQSAAMRTQGIDPIRLSQSNAGDLYWTAAQMLTHHASNGCNLRPGDLLGSGTISGAAKDARGCLLERTWRGTEPLQLPTSEERRFLEDGDTVIMRGFCERPGFQRIGLGECRGMVQA